MSDYIDLLNKLDSKQIENALYNMRADGSWKSPMFLLSASTKSQCCWKPMGTETLDLAFFFTEVARQYLIHLMSKQSQQEIMLTQKVGAPVPGLCGAQSIAIRPPFWFPLLEVLQVGIEAEPGSGLD